MHSRREFLDMAFVSRRWMREILPMVSTTFSNQITPMVYKYCTKLQGTPQVCCSSLKEYKIIIEYFFSPLFAHHTNELQISMNIAVGKWESTLSKVKKLFQILTHVRWAQPSKDFKIHLTVHVKEEFIFAAPQQGTYSFVITQEYIDVQTMDLYKWKQWTQYYINLHPYNITKLYFTYPHLLEYNKSVGSKNYYNNMEMEQKIYEKMATFNSPQIPIIVCDMSLFGDGLPHFSLHYLGIKSLHIQLISNTTLYITSKCIEPCGNTMIHWDYILECHRETQHLNITGGHMEIVHYYKNVIKKSKQKYLELVRGVVDNAKAREARKSALIGCINYYFPKLLDTYSDLESLTLVNMVAEPVTLTVEDGKFI